jgi:hypothetical protein
MIEMPERRMSDDPDAPAVVEDENRPQMSDSARPPRRISGKVVLMPEEPTATGKGRKRMEPVPKKGAKKGAKRGAAARRKGPLPEQLEPRPTRRGAAGEPGYVRIRVRVENGELSVQDLRHVEGPLVAHEELHGDLAYEVTLGGKRVTSGAIPDVPVMRSFPPTEPAPGQEGHHFAPATSFEFLVRVPKEAISEQALPRLGIALYRIKEGPVPRTEGPEQLGKRFPKELREVGRVQGIRIEHLPKSAQAEARRALR